MKYNSRHKGHDYKTLEIDNSQLSVKQVERECSRFVKENRYCSIIKTIKTDKEKVLSVLSFKDGKLHNEMGPAVIKVLQKSARKEYYLDGNRVNYDDWLMKNFPEKKLKILK